MSESSVIHDIGYQRYTGPRLGRGAVFGAIYVHGLRAAYGLGRSAKAKIFPWLVVGIVTLVAVILAAVRSQTGIVPLGYLEFADAMSWLIIFFVAIVAPELVSRDLRAGVLPLYFSRPLRAADYIGAKVAAMVTAVWALLAVPQFIMFLGAAFTTKKGMSDVWHELGDLLPGWGYSLLWALVFTGIGLLVASLTGKRAFAAGGIVAVFLMTTPVVGVLSILPSTDAQEMAGLASPMSLVSGVGEWLVPSAHPGLMIGRYGPVYAIEALTLVVTCLLLLLARYRRVAAL
ncbi:ABC transporter permease [Actinoplanes sp. NPDC049681]|uniref:ABC transporter permease n=1 Tax=Actinoplanes sp. NPDC049681 TaxID=3363905 RepID=UPI00378E3776